MSAPSPTSGLTLFTQWGFNWVALTVGAAATLWYLAMARRLRAVDVDWSTAIADERHADSPWWLDDPQLAVRPGLGLARDTRR